MLSFDETVTNPVNGFDHGLIGLCFEFLSQIFDVRIHAAVNAGCPAVQVVEELLTGEGLPGAAGEEL